MPHYAGSAVTRPDAINIFTCTGNWFRWMYQRFKLWTATLPRWFVTRVFGREPNPVSLKRLNILYTAGWLRADRFPKVRGWPQETGKYRWMLFCANFGGEWDPYRQAFLDTLPQ